MKIKWFLIIAPTLLSLGLLQSYLWVPTYDTQIKGNPERAFKFIEASIGDAKILNPILHADTASGRIADFVFEGLLDLDENLNLRPRLATGWSMTENAYLLVNSEGYFPDGHPITASAMEERIKVAIAMNDHLKNLVKKITLLPQQQQIKEITLQGDNKEFISIQLKINKPERLKFSLRHIDQNFFTLLEPVLGVDYEKKEGD